MDQKIDERSAARSRDGTGYVGRRFYPVYAPAELAGAINDLRGGDGRRVGFEEPDFGQPSTPDAPPSTSEDANRLRVLDRIAADPRGHQRRAIIGFPAMVRRVAALSASAPHFGPAIDLVARAALVSWRTATPLRLPPILLLGEPGIGKSHALRCLAQAIGADFSLIAANLTDPFRLRGMGSTWRGAKPGLVAEILLRSSTAPVVMVDEFDKAVGGQLERPYDVWHSLLERENARHFKDDYLEIELRADQVTWFASANDVSALPSSIVDRLLVLEIPTPNREQLRMIIASIYAACREAYGGAVPAQLAEGVTDELAGHNPRRIGRLLDLAFGYAAAEGRRALGVEDVRAARRLVDAGARQGFRRPVGFTPARSP